MKKLICLLLLLAMTISMLPMALAEEPVLLWEADEIDTIDNEADRFFVRAGDEWGLADIDGNVLIDPVYGKISSIDPTKVNGGHYIVIKENGLNNQMVVDAAGKVVTTDTYGYVRKVSDNWLICGVLSYTDGADYDYSFWTNDNHAVAERYDVYYLPTAACVGQMTREMYNDARGYGDYLLVRDDLLQLHLYDAAFQPAEAAIAFEDKWPPEIYAIARKGLTSDAITHRITGEVLGTGYSYVANPYDYGATGLLDVKAKRGGYGVMDFDGTVVVPAEYDALNYSGTIRAYKVRNDGMVGVVDAETGVTLPCAYTDILGKGVVNGKAWYCVELDGKVGFVNEQGEVTIDISIPKEQASVLGCSLAVKEADGAYRLVAADGTSVLLNGVAEVRTMANASNGRYVLVKNAEGQWGIMNWHGQIVVDYCRELNSAFKFVSPTRFILDGNCMYELQ